jgi:hypothetical protein
MQMRLLAGPFFVHVAARGGMGRARLLMRSFAGPWPAVPPPRASDHLHGHKKSLFSLSTGLRCIVRVSLLADNNLYVRCICVLQKQWECARVTRPHKMYIMHNVKLAISSQVQMGVLTQWAAGGAAARPIHKIIY